MPDPATDHRARLCASKVSHRGRRPRQEDSVLVLQSDSGTIVAVADGMGGHAGGSVASRIAVEQLAGAFERITPGESFEACLSEAAESANRAILDRGRESPELVGLGTTVVVVWVSNGRATVAHAGDSRAWIVTADEIQQITRDHTAVQDSIDRGDLHPEEAERSPYRHAILRNLGDPGFPGLEFSPAGGQLELSPNCILLLTSDGAHGALTQADILEHMTGTATIADGLEHLLRLAYHYGSDDNISLVACEIGRFPRSRVTSQTPPPIPGGEPVPRRSGRRHARSVVVVLLTLLAVLVVLLVVMSGIRSSDSKEESEVEIETACPFVLEDPCVPRLS